MKRRRKTEISLQLSETIAIRNSRVWITWCPACCKRAQMISADDAARAAKHGAREIYRLVEAGRLHFREDENGLLYVCLDSLQMLFNERSKGKP